MALVQYWGCGVRHVQLLLLTVCGIVGGILIKTVEASIIMVDEDTRYNNFTLFDDVFRLKVKTWTSGQKYILKNAPTVPRFLASLVSGLASTGRWNLKYFLLMNFAVLSAQSYVIPLVAKKVSFDYLLAAVLMQGFFYGMIPPTTTAILARWTPHQEIGRTVTLVLSSRFLGHTLIYTLASFLQASLAGWHSLFYIVGNLGLLWCVAWFTFGFQDPKGCFYLSLEERKFIFANIQDIREERYVKGHSIPWPSIFKCLPLYGAFSTLVATSWIFEMIANNTLTEDYLYRHKGISLSTVYNVRFLLPSAFTVAQVLVAAIVDTLIRRNDNLLSYVRKTCNSIGCWGSSMALLWLCYDCEVAITASFYLAFFFVNTLRFVGSQLVCFDVTRDYAGLLHGLVDFIACIPEAYYLPIMDPMILHVKPSRLSIETHYRHIWYVAAILTMVGNFIYIIVANRERLPTPKPKKNGRMSLMEQLNRRTT